MQYLSAISLISEEYTFKKNISFIKKMLKNSWLQKYFDQAVRPGIRSDSTANKNTEAARNSYYFITMLNRCQKSLIPINSSGIPYPIFYSNSKLWPNLCSWRFSWPELRGGARRGLCCGPAFLRQPREYSCDVLYVQEVVTRPKILNRTILSNWVHVT